MKRWAKVLLVIAIVWIVLSVFLSFYLCRAVDKNVACMQEGYCPVRNNCHFVDMLLWSFVLDIPAWIMFIVVAILGRSKGKK
ncbi:hypothetical protein HN935_02420 [archaeon]|jgi:hypothetical protein|nr:hypothetical protein [archaeon]